jgi:hypothetical protein
MDRTASSADSDDDGKYERYQIGLWGDVPYGDLQAQIGVPNLIKHMNSFPLRFSVVRSHTSLHTGHNHGQQGQLC